MTTVATIRTRLSDWDNPARFGHVAVRFRNVHQDLNAVVAQHRFLASATPTSARAGKSRFATTGSATSDGDWDFGPVNPSRGFKPKAHPPEATGVAQCVELFQPLRGEPVSRVDGTRIALAHNIGGPTAESAAKILEGPCTYGC